MINDTAAETDTQRCYQLTDELVLIIGQEGVGIYTNEGHIHLLAPSNTKQIHISQNLVAALREVYTPVGHPTIQDCVKASTN